MNINATKIGRFAPSPSGVMHLGNIMSSLLAWLDVRSESGKLIFRMEDLDPDRSNAEYAVQIASDLKFLGLDWEIGWENRPGDSFAQSSRTALYEDVFGLLMNKDLLYPCYCTRSERLAASAPHPGNNCTDRGCKCRYLSASERRLLEAEGRKPAWKVKVPDREISFTDGHYGKQLQNLADSGDFIIKRSDGVFAYQLAVSFDDMDMGVNRVVRGRDLLSSTAKQIWLIGELGGTVPEYCHAPLLVTEDKRKMSKRNGDLSMEILTEKYTAEEIIGHLAYLLKLTDSDRPVSANELVHTFDWAKIPQNDIELK